MRRPIAAAVVLAVALVACGGSDSGTPDLQGGDGSPDASPTAPTQAFTPEIDPDATSLDAISTGLDAKPVFTTPTDEEPPTELVVEDIVAGDGAEATAGTNIAVHYTGVAWSTGAEFDSSWGGTPFVFSLGSGRVITGWDQGLQGMKVGGRRLLIIPPDMAYGDQGAGARIAPGETLAFVVDLLEVDEGS